MMVDLITRVWVPGHPKTKGSLDFYGPGRVEENVKGSKEWRALVAAAVRRDLEARSPTTAGAPFIGPVEVMCAFWLDPPTPSRIGGMATWGGAGDVDKLSRNVLDACAADAKDAAMNGGAFENDNQVVDLRALKLCANGRPGSSGLLLTVHTVDPERWRFLEAALGAAKDEGRDTVSNASRQRKCRLTSCDKPVTGAALFCGPHYFALPKELQRGLWKPLYGGAEHIKACLKHLST